MNDACPEAPAPRRLTVVQTLPALVSGGVEKGTLEIARALVDAGHRSIVISHGGPMVEQLVREGSEHIAMPVHRKSLKSLFQIRPFRRLLRELQPDIVHARSRIPAWIAWLALRKMDPATRPRFVTTVHGMYSVSPYSAIMTRGEVVIAISESVLAYIRDNYPRCPESRIRLIYRGADTAEFPYGLQPPADWLAHWQQDFPELAGKTVIGLPGRLSRVKGHETLLQAVKALLPDHPDVHGLIIGGAEEAKADYEIELRQRVAELGLSAHISFTGQRSDMRHVLTRCDLTLSVRTTPEAFGRSTLEPLRLGRPVIGWDEGGVGEMLRQLFPFGAVTPHDQAALVQRLREWLATRPVPAPSEAFSLQKMCGDTLVIYARLSDGRR